MIAFQTHVERELVKARELHPPIASVHAAYAIVLEELEEFWEEVRKRPGLRNLPQMCAELIQIAAMAQRAAEDLKLLEVYRPG